MTILKNKFGLLILLSALFVSCSVSRRLSREFKNEEANREDLRGIVVYDILRDKQLINYNGNKYFIPASTVKLFTFYTAYSTLPDSVPSLEYLEKGDSLLIRGTADPLVLETEEDQVVRFLKESDSKIFLVDQLIDDDVYGPGWSWDDFSYGFMPERSLFPLYGNRVRISRTNDSLAAVPDFFKEAVEDSPNLGSSYKTMRTRESFQNHFSVNALQEGESLEVPYITSNQLAADLLGEAIDKKVTLIKGFEKETFIQLTTQSYDSLYTQMLVNSDNFIAEQLMLQISRKTDSVYQVKKAIDHALSNLLSDIPQKPRWVDGSGLSRYNLFTPESMVYVLKKLYREVPHDKLLSYLPAGGVSGTLEDSFKGPGGKPYVFAKSGTLSNNYCLSGFIRTKRGKLLIFSFMNNHYIGSSGERKKEIQDYLLQLYEAN